VHPTRRFRSRIELGGPCRVHDSRSQSPGEFEFQHRRRAFVDLIYSLKTHRETFDHETFH
jgi:hypothetical protein